MSESVVMVACSTCAAVGAIPVQVFLPGQFGVPDPTLACESCIDDAAAAGGVVARLRGARGRPSEADLARTRERFAEQAELYPTGLP